MKPEQLKAERVAEVIQAYVDGKLIQFRRRYPQGKWTSPIQTRTLDLNFNFRDYEYRIAKERQSLPHIPTSTGEKFEVYIDTDGLHVGCTTISFERVREIAAACRRWQNEEAPKRREWWVNLYSHNPQPSVVLHSTKEEARDGQTNGNRQNCALETVQVREVLPGEEDL